MQQKIRIQPNKILVSAQVSRATWERVIAAARAVDQPNAAWLRMAIMEKLERDES